VCVCVCMCKCKNVDMYGRERETDCEGTAFVRPVFQCVLQCALQCVVAVCVAVCAFVRPLSVRPQCVHVCG